VPSKRFRGCRGELSVSGARSWVFGSCVGGIVEVSGLMAGCWRGVGGAILDFSS
jgi:hypothetical protein